MRLRKQKNYVAVENPSLKKELENEAEKLKQLLIRKTRTSGTVGQRK